MGREKLSRNKPSDLQKSWVMGSGNVDKENGCSMKKMKAKYKDDFVKRIPNFSLHGVSVF